MNKANYPHRACLLRWSLMPLAHPLRLRVLLLISERAPQVAGPLDWRLERLRIHRRQPKAKEDDRVREEMNGEIGI